MLPACSFCKQAGGKTVPPKNTLTIQLKNILFNVIKQNENTDNMLEMIKDSGNSLTTKQIILLSKTANIINTKMANILKETKKIILKAESSRETMLYSSLILNNSKSLESRTGKLLKISKKFLSANSRSFFRDAPISGKKSKKGVDLSLIIKRYDAAAKFSLSAENLKKTSARLRAAAKWLYIVSK